MSGFKAAKPQVKPVEKVVIQKVVEKDRETEAKNIELQRQQKALKGVFVCFEHAAVIFTRA